MASNETAKSGLNVRGSQLADYVTSGPTRVFPPHIVDAAKRALVDVVGVAIGAANEEVVPIVRRLVETLGATGNAPMFLGGRTAPAMAVLVNGTMAHATDFDDMHPGGAGHPSGPCWATALAMASHHGLDEKLAIAGFMVGYEVTAKLGGGGAPGGVGRTLQRKGFFPTSVLSRVGAAAAASAMLRFDRQKTENALGVAMTTACGLLASNGTHSKSYQAGRAAMEGIVAAQLAGDGFRAATNLFELKGGFLSAFIQDGVVEVPPLDDFGEKWELLGNRLKPFASCGSTQASAQAAQSLAARVGDRKVVKVHAKVHPNALITGGRLNPKSALEGKFSVPFCIALGLRGYKLAMTDFREEMMKRSAVMDIVPVVQLEAVQGQAPHSAHLDVYLDGGEHLHADTDVVKGHPDNPMSWDDLYTKFSALVEPIIGRQKGDELYDHLRHFDRPGSLAKVNAVLGARPVH